MAIKATAQAILDAAFDELGLPRESIALGAPGQVGIQSTALLNALGDDLVKDHDWQFLEGVATITGDGVADEFALPSDFGRIVDQTIWATSQKLPVHGPLNSQDWGWVQFGIVSAGVFYRYRILDDKIAVFPVPPSGEVINFYYIKKNWVINSLDSTMTDVVTLPDDTPLFDRSLLRKGVKLRLWGQKGFDTTLLGKEFEDDLALERAQNQGAPVINLSNSRNNILLDPVRNITEGDWN